MKKSELKKAIEAKGGKTNSRQTAADLQTQLNKLIARGTMSTVIVTADADPGKWDTAKDWFPTITVNQETKTIGIATFKTSGFQKNASIETDMDPVEFSDDRTQALITGIVSCRNWNDWRASKDQSFCFAVFVGDSGHIYTHRAPATRGWMNANPNKIRARLRKLGIGAAENVLQQGDFLLKPANGNAYPDEDFAHERMGSGHHNFELPQLYCHGQFWVKEPTTLVHTATDGIQHPDVTVPPGKYIVGTTANQLEHDNARD